MNLQIFVPSTHRLVPVQQKGSRCKVEVAPSPATTKQSDGFTLSGKYANKSFFS